MTDSQRGFLLMEVLIAIVIIAVSVTAAVGGMGRALKLAGRSEAFTLQSLPLESLLFELETGMRPGLLEEGGAAEADGSEFLIEPRLVMPEKAEDPAQEPVHPFYVLKINPAGAAAAGAPSAEIFLGREIFS